MARHRSATMASMRHLCGTIGTVLLFVAMAACSPPEEETPRACNGSALLCDRRVDEVVFAGTHNAHATEDDRIVAANQYSSVDVQLSDGIRALMLDTYEHEGEVVLCHGPCGLGHTRLVDTLALLKAFLDANPHEVVLLLFEDYVTPEQTKAAFDEAGLTALMYAHERSQIWPTLGALIDSGRRVVAFAQNEGGGEPDWYLDLFEQSWDTPYAAKTREELSCEYGRGDPDAPLFVLNHFLTNPLASATLAAEVNFNPFLLDRARACQQASGRLPNVIAVDYYEVGDLFAAVDMLNGL